MGMKRTIDSSAWNDEDFAELSASARLLWFGLHFCVDDQGRMIADLDSIKASLLPFSKTPKRKLESWLFQLQTKWHLKLYEVDGNHYFQIADWWETQKIRLPLFSAYPPPPGWADRPGYTLDDKAYSGDWPVARKQALTRDSYRCVECGETEPLEVHHIVPVRMGGVHDVAFLVTLCRPCHRRLHRHINRNGLTEEATKWLADVS
jgi:hypothetical protein